MKYNGTGAQVYSGTDILNMHEMLKSEIAQLESGIAQIRCRKFNHEEASKDNRLPVKLLMKVYDNKTKQLQWLLDTQFTADREI